MEDNTEHPLQGAIRALQTMSTRELLDAMLSVQSGGDPSLHNMKASSLNYAARRLHECMMDDMDDEQLICKTCGRHEPCRHCETDAEALARAGAENSTGKTDSQNGN